MLSTSVLNELNNNNFIGVLILVVVAVAVVAAAAVVVVVVVVVVNFYLIVNDEKNFSHALACSTSTIIFFYRPSTGMIPVTLNKAAVSNLNWFSVYTTNWVISRCADEFSDRRRKLVFRSKCLRVY
jgi:hypothetical protein